MSEHIPQLTFTYAMPLDGKYRQLYKDNNWEGYPGIDEVLAEVDEWREVWSNLNEGNKAIKKIIDLTGVPYPRDIEAYIVGAGLQPMSRPLILPVKLYMDKEKKGMREDLVLHELLHIFVADMDDFPRLQNYWDTLFEKRKEENPQTLYHIIIYAFLEKLMEEFFSDVNISDFIGDDWDNYLRAYEIMRQEGSDAIIGEFRELTQAD